MARCYFCSHKKETKPTVTGIYTEAQNDGQPKYIKQNICDHCFNETQWPGVLDAITTIERAKEKYVSP